MDAVQDAENTTSDCELHLDHHIIKLDLQMPSKVVYS